MGKSRYSRVLLSYTYRSIDKDDADCRMVDGRQCPYHGILLDDILDAALLPHTCRIYDSELAVFVIDLGVDGISGRTGDIGYDGSVIACHPVGKRRLTGIGPSYESYSDPAVLFVTFIYGREVVEESVKELTYTEPVGSGDRDDLAES